MRCRRLRYSHGRTGGGRLLSRHRCRRDRHCSAIGLIAPDGQRLDLARFIVRQRAICGVWGRRAAATHGRYRRAAILVQRRKYHARTGFGVDVDRGFFARDDLLGEFSRCHAVRQLCYCVGWRRHNFGWTGIGFDDGRLTGARRSDVGTVGEGGPRSHHREQENDHHRDNAAASTFLDLIHTPIIVAVLIGIGVVRIALVSLVLLRVVGTPIQRIIIARRIWFGCVSVLRLFMILRLGHRPCIALQRMHRTGVVLRLGILDRAFLSVGALQPGRRTRGRPDLRLKVRLKIRLERALIIIARTGARLWEFQTVPQPGQIGLADGLGRFTAQRILAAFLQGLAQAVQHLAERALAGAIAEKAVIVLQLDIEAVHVHRGQTGRPVAGDARYR